MPFSKKEAMSVDGQGNIILVTLDSDPICSQTGKLP